MDRLRSLQYFIACAEEGSLSGAARRLEVSVPAVAKLVGALERHLGISLFERSAQGLALTAAGEAYLESCTPAVRALDELDDQVRNAGTRPRGTVVLGVQPVAARALLSLLERFRARHPEIQLDLREGTQMVQPDMPGIDLFVSFCWPRNPDMVHRPLLQSRFVVCATPEYWAAHGVPRHPRDLAQHDCVLMRSQTGTLMDVWSFERDGHVENVTVAGSLLASNLHRDIGVALGATGAGVLRILDWSHGAELRERGLQAVLEDWGSREAPPLHLSWRPSSRRLARVRAMIDFLQESAREITPVAPRAGPAPRWAGSRIGRASSIPLAGKS